MKVESGRGGPGEAGPAAWRRLPLVALGAGTAALALSTAGMLRGAEPFATWFYPLAWYSTLLALDGALALSSGRFLLLGRPAHAATLLGWSAVLWLFFELLNFRLRNWYYVFVPPGRAARWAGILLSFATVLPALFVTEGLLASRGLGRRARWPRLRVTPGRLAALRIAGATGLVLPLIWPRAFFPLAWIALAPLAEPFTYRGDPARSLLADLEAGRPGRLLRLLVAGGLIGLLWELLNARARGKWIYTVPGLEDLKLFEMPVLGFLGFPVFAVECFAAWQVLVRLGLAAPRNGPVRRAPAGRRIAAAAAGLAFSAAVLLGMERWTVASRTPRLEDLPGVPGAALARAGHDVFSLAAAVPDDLGPRGEEPRPETAGARARPLPGEWIEAARLAALRGIGTGNLRRLRALGIASVAELAAADPDSLSARSRLLGRLPAPGADPGGEITRARARVWVRAARAAVREDGDPWGGDR